MGLARSGVPRKQLDFVVFRVLRRVCDAVSDVQRVLLRQPYDRDEGVLQQMDDADWARPAVPDGLGSSARVAEIHGEESHRSIRVAGGALGVSLVALFAV